MQPKAQMNLTVWFAGGTPVRFFNMQDFTERHSGSDHTLEFSYIPDDPTMNTLHEVKFYFPAIIGYSIWSTPEKQAS